MSGLLTKRRKTMKVPDEILNGLLDGDFHKALLFDNNKAYVIDTKCNIVTQEEQGEVFTVEAPHFKLELLGLPLFFRNATFGDFWRWVVSGADAALLGKIYAEAMYYCPIEKFLKFEPVAKPAKTGKWDMEHLELYWIVANEGKLFVNPGFHGLGPVLDTDGFPFSVEYMTLGELSPYEVTVNHNKKIMLLRDALEAILGEISYHNKSLYPDPHCKEAKNAQAKQEST